MEDAEKNRSRSCPSRHLLHSSSFHFAYSSRLDEDEDDKTRIMLLSFVRNYPAIKMAKRFAQAKQKEERKTRKRAC